MQARIEPQKQFVQRSAHRSHPLKTRFLVANTAKMTISTLYKLFKMFINLSLHLHPKIPSLLGSSLCKSKFTSCLSTVNSTSYSLPKNRRLRSDEFLSSQPGRFSGSWQCIPLQALEWRNESNLVNCVCRAVTRASLSFPLQNISLKPCKMHRTHNGKQCTPVGRNDLETNSVF